MIDTRGRQIEKQKRWIISLIAAAGLSCAGFAMVRGLARSHDGTERGRAQLAADRDAPLRIEPVPPRVAIDAKRADAALERLKMARPPTLATALHVIRLFGGEIDAEAPDNQKHHRHNDLLFIHKARIGFFGDRPALVETREGVRCRTGDVTDRLAPRQAERQAHADQFLSVLAETGVPLSQTITTDHGPRDARAVLADSLANFDPNTREILMASSTSNCSRHFRPAALMVSALALIHLHDIPGQSYARDDQGPTPLPTLMEIV